MNICKCKRCGTSENLTYLYKGDYYCNNNRCLNLLFSRLVYDDCIRVDDKNKASFYDEYYNSNGKYIGDDTCTNRLIIDQVPEVKAFVNVNKCKENKYENRQDI